MRKNLKIDLRQAMEKKLIGQPAAVEDVARYVETYHSGLAPEGRPAGIFLLLGPTGTGKTRTVEVLAETLHGTSQHLLRIDCAEFQMEHEVARLIGAPPGYLGHRETQPLLNQLRVNTISSERSDLSIILFDEIEKAAPSLTRLLLGILDRAVLRLGDNTTVNFERCLIFMTSNLGARQMADEIAPRFGFPDYAPGGDPGRDAKLDRICVEAVRRRFSPEFVNRLDTIVTYHPLSRDSHAQILDLQLANLQMHIHQKLGQLSFDLDVSGAAREFLLAVGTSAEYGARALKRTIEKHLTQPLAAAVYRCEVPPGCTVQVGAWEGGLTFQVLDEEDDASGCLDAAA